MSITEFTEYLQDNNIIINEKLMWDWCGLLHCYIKERPQHEIAHYRKKRNIDPDDYREARETFYHHKRARDILRTGRMNSRNPYYKIRTETETVTLQSIVDPLNILDLDNSLLPIPRAPTRANYPNYMGGGLITETTNIRAPEILTLSPYFQGMIKDLYIKADCKEDCPICLIEIEGADLKTMKCGHHIHSDCHDALISATPYRGDRKCPICRDPFH